ncbi:TPA: SPFH domain-containing protein, partial [Legionella pneumophila]
MMIELLIGIAVLLLIFVLTGLFIVKQQEVALIERLGKYHSIAHAGLNFKIPFIDW